MEASVTRRRWVLKTHRDPDIDDTAAILAIRKIGESEYPGISEAVIETTAERRPGGKTADQLEAEGVICIGINGGKFDEHAFDDAAPLRNDCAATLVAKRFGADQHPGLSPILDNAFGRNHSSLCGHFEISVLSKLAFRHLSHTGNAKKDKEMTEKIFNATFLFLEAVYADGMAEYEGRVLSGKVTWSIDLYIASWLLSTHRPKLKLSINPFAKIARRSGKSVTDVVADYLGNEIDSNFDWLLKYARDHQTISNKRLDVPSFEIWYLVELVQKHLCINSRVDESIALVGRAVNLFFDAMLAKERSFGNCLKDFESASTHVSDIVTRSKKGKTKALRITSVVSSNPEMPKFCRSELGGWTAVGIKQDPDTKNVLIFFDKRYQIDPVPIVVAIRKAELLAKGLSPDNLPQSTLKAQGAISGATEWFFDGKQLMNGSLTANVEATSLSRELIEKIVRTEVRKQFPEP